MEPPTREEWGPLVWRLVHLQAIAYADVPTDQDKQRAKAHYEALFQFLPCPECMEHFAEVLKALPVDSHLESPKQLIDWTHAVHNRVNQRLGKAEITKQEFYKLYASAQAPGRCRDPSAATATQVETRPVPEASTAPVTFAKASELQRHDLPAALQARPVGATPAAVKAGHSKPASAAAPSRLVRPLQHVAVVRPTLSRQAPLPPSKPTQQRQLPAPKAAPPAAARPPQVPLPMAGRRTLKMGPPKPVGHRANKGCTNCR